MRAIGGRCARQSRTGPDPGRQGDTLQPADVGGEVVADAEFQHRAVQVLHQVQLIPLGTYGHAPVGVHQGDVRKGGVVADELLEGEGIGLDVGPPQGETTHAGAFLDADEGRTIRLAASGIGHEDGAGHRLSGFWPAPVARQRHRRRHNQIPTDGIASRRDPQRATADAMRRIQAALEGGGVIGGAVALGAEILHRPRRHHRPVRLERRRDHAPGWRIGTTDDRRDDEDEGEQTADGRRSRHDGSGFIREYPTGHAPFPGIRRQRHEIRC